MPIKSGKYIHCKGNEYQVIGSAIHSETLEEMVIYRALYGDGGTWVRPAKMWDEIIEYNGRYIKRFTHEDEIVAEPPPGIHKDSTNAEKVALFLTLFTGREDVFAKRFENSNKSGYAPVCHNFWKIFCPKRNKGKIKCSECPNQNFARFDADAVKKHLKGELTIGVYPMLPDETCRFLVFDFDSKKDYNPEELQHDVTAIREVCAEKDISMAVERSRSGMGIHFWIFFAENIPASVARKFGSSIITYAMSKNHKLAFKTYARLIPAQDTFIEGGAGFGNLIALPLQLKPREQEHSMFIDENFMVYPDQWNYLYNVKKCYRKFNFPTFRQI